MTIWDNFSMEERAVMETALLEGFVNEVIPDFLGKSYCRGTIRISNVDPEKVRPLIPAFRRALIKLVRDDLIELRVTPEGNWDSAAQLSAAQTEELLTQNTVWDSIPNDDTIMVMIMTTDRADALLGR